MLTYKAQVKAGGRYITVEIQARNGNDAKAMLEAQYGRGNIVVGPTRA